MEALATSTATVYLVALVHSDSLVLIARAAPVEAQQLTHAHRTHAAPEALAHSTRTAKLCAHANKTTTATIVNIKSRATFAASQTRTPSYAHNGPAHTARLITNTMMCPSQSIVQYRVICVLRAKTRSQVVLLGLA